MSVSGIFIPQSSEKLNVELSVKEAMALSSGVNFWAQPRLVAQARNKIRVVIERQLIPQSDKLHYEAIEV
jgi:hypothetical protein